MAGSFAPSTFLMGSYRPNLNDEYDSSRIAAAEKPRYNAGAPSVFTILEIVATMFCCNSELLAHHRRLDPVHGALRDGARGSGQAELPR